MKEEKNYIVHQLIETTDFEHLTQDQRHIVLSITTEAEYRRQRKTLLLSLAEFELDGMLMQPNPEILKKLQTKLSTPKKQSFGMGKLFAYKMPVYQAVAAILIAFFSAVLLLKETPKTEYVEQKVTVFQQVHDTVYVDRINEVITTKIVTVQQPTIQLNPQKMPDLEMAQMPNTNKPNIQDFNKTYGNSPMSEKELNQFRVSL